jgi:hypothetical protein
MQAGVGVDRVLRVIGDRGTAKLRLIRTTRRVGNEEPGVVLKKTPMKSPSGYIRQVTVERTGTNAWNVTGAVAEVVLKDSRGVDSTKPFVFPAFSRLLLPDGLYTLDPCPNDWYGYWCAQVVDGLCGGRANALYDRLATPPAPGDGAGLPGQAAFLAGLDAFRAAGRLHDFEPGKRAFIGGHGRTPVLLVQGPPGTGKSYSTVYAVFARLQGAMREDRPCRAVLSCKSHAATDVLHKNVLEVQHKLRELRAADPALFTMHFDARLLDVPLYRVAPNDPPPPGVIHLPKDADKESGQGKNADVIQEHPWAVVAATPGGTYGMLKQKWPGDVFGHGLCDLLVLDEASQMNLPEAVMAARPLRAGAPVVVVGDHASCRPSSSTTVKTRPAAPSLSSPPSRACSTPSGLRTRR